MVQECVGSSSDVSVLAEGSRRGDHVEERGDPFTERLPERGPAREGGSEAEPDAAGHPEEQRAESQGEGAQQEGEEPTRTPRPAAAVLLWRTVTTRLCPGSGFANRAAV